MLYGWVGLICWWLVWVCYVCVVDCVCLGGLIGWFCGYFVCLLLFGLVCLGLGFWWVVCLGLGFLIVGVVYFMV